MNTVLVKPNGKKGQYQGVNGLSAIEPPLWLALMANCYENPKIVDCELEGLSLDDSITRILKLEPKEVIILVTGSHPSAHIQQKDIAFELAGRIEGKNVRVSVYDYLNFDPTALTPRWDLLDMNKYRAHNWHSWANNCERVPYGTVFTSISCPYKCKFCTVKSFYGDNNYKKREVSLVLEDFYKLFYQYKIKNFKIMDELFASNTGRTKEICNCLSDSGIGEQINIWAYARIDTVNNSLLKLLRKAGVKWLAYGIEHADVEIRSKVAKGEFNNSKIYDIIQMTKDNGINIVGNYMFGFWEDNLDSMNRTLDFALNLNCEYSNFYCLVAYPNSELYTEMKAKGVELPKDSKDYAQMASSFKPLPTKYLSAKEVLEFRDNAFQIYYNNENYLKNIKRKFGMEAIKDISDMLNIKIERDILK